MTDIHLQVQHAVKRFGGVVALADGSIDVQRGQVVALLGANGSGKSTLSKIITGVLAPNEGELTVDGSPVRFTSPQAAKRRGISAVYQELSLIPDLSVMENIFLTHEPMRAGMLNRRAMRDETRRLIGLFEGTVPTHLTPDAVINELTPDEKQIVEILKTLSQKPRLMILDEATASLDSQQVDRLFELVRAWKNDGMAIVFVSHRMEEIFRIADSATVLRNGRTVGTRQIDQTDEHELVDLMIEGAGALNRQRTSEVSASAPVRLAVHNLSTRVLRDISFQLRDGELLGLGGLQGQGQTDLLQALFGVVHSTGTITLSGQSVRFRHPRQAMDNAVALVPGERGAEGLLLIRSILDNLQLPSWRSYGIPLKMKRAYADGQRMSDELRLVMASLDAPVNSLSGGNAQKVVLGKWLLRSPRLLLLNDPTKGVDVGAKTEFYALLNRLRETGTAILFYSSDDDELLGLCDRVLVMRDGAVCAELHGDGLTRASLVAASVGVTHAPKPAKEGR